MDHVRVSVTAIILARGGSKGVPRKNVASVAGRPCIAWTIEHAFASTRVSRAIVSTDDEQIAHVAWSEGAEVVWRPAELASDTARVDDAARHAVRAIESGETYARDDRRGPGKTSVPSQSPVALLYGNVPVRPTGLLDAALALLEHTGADSVQSYARVGKHHPWWQARVDETTREVRAWEGEVLNHGVFRRQDLPPSFIPDGGVLVVTKRALFGEIEGVLDGPHAFFGRDRRGVITSEGDVVDIDAPIDLLVADAILRGGAR